MKGVEIAEEFYREYGESLLNEFSDYSDRITAGLVGEGSECLGFDDEVSRDHDFEAGFCLWIDEADEREIGFKLERAYAKLPKEFRGIERGFINPAGGRRKGVLVSEEFCSRYLYGGKAPESNIEWMRTPSEYLAIMGSGKIFKEGRNKFSEVRKRIIGGYPEDVVKKKLASSLILMEQSGHYNYKRCIEHGESGAAQLAIYEYVNNATKAAYLLNNKYRPYYKWIFRGMRDFEVLSEIEEPLEYLLESGNDERERVYKEGITEDISGMIIKEIAKKGWGTDSDGLENQAFFINSQIADAELRNGHIIA